MVKLIIWFLACIAAPISCLGWHVLSHPMEQELVRNVEVALEDGVDVYGSIEVEDGGGFARTEADGFLQVTVWRGQTGKMQDIPVRRGHWRMHCFKSNALSFSSLTLGGRPAMVVFPNSRLDVAQWNNCVVRARWSVAPLIHVLDAESDHELGDVTIVRASGEQPRCVEYP